MYPICNQGRFTNKFPALECKVPGQFNLVLYLDLKETSMSIRTASYRDAPAIKSLLEVLGYHTRISLLVSQLESIIDNPDHEVIVYELRSEVVGFAAIHYLPQLAFDGGLMIITYFAVDEITEHARITEELENYITDRARQHRC